MLGVTSLVLISWVRVRVRVWVGVRVRVRVRGDQLGAHQLG